MSVTLIPASAAALVIASTASLNSGTGALPRLKYFDSPTPATATLSFTVNSSMGTPLPSWYSAGRLEVGNEVCRSSDSGWHRLQPVIFGTVWEEANATMLLLERHRPHGSAVRGRGRPPRHVTESDPRCATRDRLSEI